jgi:NADH:ubiquinone oxidoreductase subunit E
VLEAECLGACGFPTAVQINDRFFENVDVGDVPSSIERLRGEAAGLGIADSDNGPDGSC